MVQFAPEHFQIKLSQQLFVNTETVFPWKLFFCFVLAKKLGQSGAFSNAPSCFHVNRLSNYTKLYWVFLTVSTTDLSTVILQQSVHPPSFGSAETHFEPFYGIIFSLNLSLKSLHSCSAQQLMAWCGNYSPFNTLTPILNLEWQFSLHLNFNSFPVVVQPL